MLPLTLTFTIYNKSITHSPFQTQDLFKITRSHTPYNPHKMQIKSFVLAASAAATASAAACSAPTNKYFGVVAIHSGSAVQYQPFSAAKSSIFAGLNSQNASCDRPDEKSATFYIQDGALYLYAASATPQEVFVDRSGMGKSHPTPSNMEKKKQKLTGTLQARARSATPPALSQPPRTPSARAGPSTNRTTSSSRART